VPEICELAVDCAQTGSVAARRTTARQVVLKRLCITMIPWSLVYPCRALLDFFPAIPFFLVSTGITWLLGFQKLFRLLADVPELAVPAGETRFWSFRFD
jgi:hypothetical protein